MTYSVEIHKLFGWDIWADYNNYDKAYETCTYLTEHGKSARIRIY